MSFYEIVQSFNDFDFKDEFENVTDSEILEIISKKHLDKIDFLKLLSPRAKNHLEKMASKAKRLSLNHFGKAVVLYTPMYISNYCVNKCSYCTFNIDNKIKRKRLTFEEIEKEAIEISKTGLKHILILTGESRSASSVDYIEKAVKILKKYFESISIEIYPLHQHEYKRLIKAGVDGLTIYQEVYNKEKYKKVHLKGPKRDYLYRLNAPQRACEENINHLNIGALLGLDDFRKEVFFTGLHGEFLSKKYSDVEMSYSLPRIKPFEGINSFMSIKDIDFVQMMLALRLFTPHFSINISTRETNEFRKHLLKLGINKMSAGVSTEVGGHSKDTDKGKEQFEIDDKSSVKQVKKMILNQGYQPVMKDWFKI